MRDLLLHAVRDWSLNGDHDDAFKRCEIDGLAPTVLGLVVPTVVRHELVIDCRPSAEKQRTFVRLALIRRVAYMWGFGVAQYCLSAWAHKR